MSRPRRPASVLLAVLVAAVLASTACTTFAPSPSVPVAELAPPDPRTIAMAISEAGLRDRLEALAAVTDAATGYRSTGSPGFDAATDLVAAELEAAGWQVAEDAYEALTFADDGHTIVELEGRTLDQADVLPLVFAPPGEVTGPVVALDWRPGVTTRDGPGCSSEDYGELPSGAIVLVRSGPCFRRQQVMAAQTAGAAAFVAGYPGAATGSPPRPTLIEPDGLTIPAVGATGPAGDALAALAAAGGVATVRSTAEVTEAPTRSIVAELPGSEPGRVVMLGAHLDSVLEGPGIDDNGSGVAALLELARALGGSRPRATIRLAFWSGEELGLQGSTHYVEGLEAADRDAIVAYLNADMLGSVNGFAGVYDDPAASPSATALEALLTGAVERAGGQPVPVAIGPNSDHMPFQVAGIPIGGVFSGAGEPLTAEQAASRGGREGQPADPCYHTACDDLDNIDLELLRVLAAALADVTTRAAMNPELIAPEAAGEVRDTGSEAVTSPDVDHAL